jgi:hypothetical protein
MQCITINLGDKSDNSELSDTEGKEDDDSDEPLAVPLLQLCCFVFIYQETVNN